MGCLWYYYKSSCINLHDNNKICKASLRSKDIKALYKINIIIIIINIIKDGLP